MCTFFFSRFGARWHCCKSALAQDIGLGSLDCFCLWESGIWERDYCVTSMGTKCRESFIGEPSNSPSELGVTVQLPISVAASLQQESSMKPLLTCCYKFQCRVRGWGQDANGIPCIENITSLVAMSISEDAGVTGNGDFIRMSLARSPPRQWHWN